MGHAGCKEQPSSSVKSDAVSTRLPSGHVTELPYQSLYLGLCWLSSSPSHCFSPSRWVPASAASLERCLRPHRPRCFTVSQRLIKESERKTNAFLVDNRVTVHAGLTVSSRNTVSVAMYTVEQLAGKSSIQVGGVSVDVGAIHTRVMHNHPSMAFVTVVAFWRAELTMDPPQYAVLGYERHVVRAPPATEADRQQYGEGCLTGLRYGAYVALLSTQPFGLALKDRLQHALPTEAAVEMLRSACPQEPVTETGADWEAAVTESWPVSHLDTDGDKEAVTTQLTEWCRAAYSNPSSWGVVSLFMQRYEAIGGCLLKA